MECTPGERERVVLEETWQSHQPTRGPAVDLTRQALPAVAEVTPSSPEEVARGLADCLGWPQWVRFYAKPALAVLAASRLARQRGLPGGVLWVAPGTGRPFDPPKGPAGLAMLRGDWAPDRRSMLQAQDDARARGLMLVVDESLTGFRLAPGGACQFYGLEPEVVLLGPALAGGGDWAALAGRGEPPAADEPEVAPQLLARVAATLERVADPRFSAHLAELGRLLFMALEFFCRRAGFDQELRWNGPPALPRIEGRRVWAFFELAREEGLILGSTVMLDAELGREQFETLVWPRLARAIRRLKVLPEGEKAPQSWPAAAQARIRQAR